MKEILERINQRLAETEQSASGASKASGKPDAIRNIQRVVESGSGSTTIDTLAALADQLKCPLKWLLFGEGQQSFNEIDLEAILDAVEGTYVMLGLDPEESSALLKIALSAAQEQPTPSSQPGYRRVLAEFEARKFLKEKQFERDGHS